MLKQYKKDQGRMVRMAAFWSVAMLLLFGCTFLHQILSGRFASMSTSVLGTLPVVGIRLNGAFLVTATLCLAGVLAVYRWQQTPKVADLLIETEAELRKVTWPSLQDVLDSSMVVIICVVFLMVFMAGADWFLGRIFRYLILGG